MEVGTKPAFALPSPQAINPTAAIPSPHDTTPFSLSSPHDTTPFSLSSPQATKPFSLSSPQATKPFSLPSPHDTTPFSLPSPQIITPAVTLPSPQEEVPEGFIDPSVVRRSRALRNRRFGSRTVPPFRRRVVLLPPLPVTMGAESSDGEKKQVRFFANVICHEYRSY